MTTLKHAQGTGPTPTNAWSEPSASTFNIRGRYYAKDGLKVASETSMFMVLGVDSFVNNKLDKLENVDVSLGTTSFLKRWIIFCEEVYWVHPPFLCVGMGL